MGPFAWRSKVGSPSPALAGRPQLPRDLVALAVGALPIRHSLRRPRPSTPSTGIDGFRADRQVSGVIAGARASSAIEVGSRRMSSITSAAPCSRRLALCPNPQGLPPQKPIAVIPATRPASMGYRRCAARQQSLDHGHGEWSRWRAVCGSWPSACRASQPILGNGSKTLSGPGVISIYR